MSFAEDVVAALPLSWSARTPLSAGALVELEHVLASGGVP